VNGVADRRHRMTLFAVPFGDNAAMKSNLIAIAATCISLLPFAASSQVLGGDKPLHVKQLASSYPNAQAIAPRFWAPGLDEGWTPQGLVVMGNYLIVTSYQDVHKNAPKCRVFRIAKATGIVSGTFDMPNPCAHAGGIADIGGGQVVVADTRQDWRVNLNQALQVGRADGATKGMIKLGAGYGSGFTFFDGKDLWNGVWAAEKDAADAKIYRVDLGLFDKRGHTVTKENAVDVVKIPMQVQGAAIDKQGNLWMSASQGENLSRLYRVDRKTGAVLAQHDMPPRIENISFDTDGKLWAISESGALKYQKDKQHFPVIFEIDVSKLK
jgi:hypothetical protein